MYLAISGLTGTGKSTLASLVAMELGIQPFLEDINEIPAYSAWLSTGEGLYQAQMDFLARAFRLQKQACSRGGVQERTIYENYEVSVRFYYEMGMLSKHEFELVTSTYMDMCQQVCGPDLLFHLTAPVETLIERITRRRRSDDFSPSLSQLQQLERYYDMMLKQWQWCRVICINTSKSSAPSVAKLIVDEARSSLPC